MECIKNGQEEHFSDADAAFFENLIKEDERDLKTLEAFAKVLNARTKLKSIKFKRSQGSVFDWFANLNEGNTIDEQKRFSEQNLDVQKKDTIRRAIVQGGGNGQTDKKTPLLWSFFVELNLNFICDVYKLPMPMPMFRKLQRMSKVPEYNYIRR